jgi:hypothetical protein
MASIPLTPRLQDLLDIVMSAGRPLTAAELAARYGASQGHTTTRLRILRKRGFIATTKPGGLGTAWAPASVAAQLRAQHEKQRREVLNARRARRAVSVKEGGHAAWAESAPQRRIVDAANCQPFRPPVPASIFNLAQRA